MRIFVSVYDRPVLALGSCLVVVLSLAYGIHRLIEAPRNGLGKMLAGRLDALLPGQMRRSAPVGATAVAELERRYEPAQAA